MNNYPVPAPIASIIVTTRTRSLMVPEYGGVVYTEETTETTFNMNWGSVAVAVVACVAAGYILSKMMEKRNKI